MATSPRSKPADKPAPVAINIDALEDEKGNDVPYVVILGGKRLQFADPTLLAWQDLNDLENPHRFAEITLETEDERKTFLETRITVKKMQRLMKGYRDHYGLGELGNDDA
jgi:hypothetical protein